LCMPALRVTIERQEQVMTYQLSRDGQLFGPYTIEDLQRYLASGNVMLTDLAKGEGMTDWVPVSQLLQPGAPPPPPASGAMFQQPAVWPAQNTYAMPVSTDRLYPFFPVSVPKFLIMSLVTLGLYHVYWAYKNWVRIKAQSDASIMPWARALFLGIWNFPLFDSVQTRAATEEIPVGWNYIVLGVGVLIFALTSRLPGGIAIISLLSFIPYLPVVATIVRINAKHAATVAEPPNDRFTGINIAGIIFGGLILALALVGFIAQITGHVPAK